MKIADPRPAFCSACHNTDLEATHVDFDAAYDGGIIVSTTGAEVPVDDLYLCRHCIQQAAELVGRDEELVTLLRNELGQARSEIGRLSRQITWLTDRPDVPRPPKVIPEKRGPGRPPKAPAVP